MERYSCLQKVRRMLVVLVQVPRNKQSVGVPREWRSCLFGAAINPRATTDGGQKAQLPILL